MSDDLLGATCGGDFVVVVFRDVVPHHHSPPLAAHRAHLSQGNATIGRAEKARVGQELTGLVGTGHILIATDEPPSGVVVGVVAYGVASALNFLDEFGVHFGVVAKAEEGCFGTIVVQSVEYELGDFRGGPIVKSEIDSVVALHLPQHSGGVLAHYFGPTEIHINFWGCLSQTKV